MLKTTYKFCLKYPTIIFLFVLTVVYGVLGFYKTLFVRPQSIHQWAQCDRASVARNFSEESMNFFLPRVHNCQSNTGITGLEFPIINYSAAICYKIFGFNEFWYRLIILSCLTLALIVAFRFSNRYLEDPVFSGILVLTWFLSPILNYYTPNFIPDTASLAFSLLSWFFFFKIIKNKSYVNIVLWFVFISLASLIKVTSAINLIAMLGIVFFDYVKLFRLQRSVPRRWMIILLSFFSLCLVFSWYAWARYISIKYSANYFAQSIVPVKSIDEAISVWESIKGFALDYYYNYPMYILFGISVVSIPFFYKKSNPFLILAVLLLLIGDVCVVYLFLFQFNQHDYYSIILLTPFFFLMLYAFKVILEFKSRVFRYIVILVLSSLCFYSLIHSMHHQKDRYQEGWMNNPQTTFIEYFDLEPKLRSLGIKREDKVASMYDYSINITLYLMNQKGWLVNKDYCEESVNNILHDCKYAVVNDIALAFKNHHQKYFSKLLGKHRGLFIFELSKEQISEDKQYKLGDLMIVNSYSCSFENLDSLKQNYLGTSGKKFANTGYVWSDSHTGKYSCLATKDRAYVIYHCIDSVEYLDHIEITIETKNSDNAGVLVLSTQTSHKLWVTSSNQMNKDTLGWATLQVEGIVPQIDKSEKVCLYTYTTKDSVLFDDIMVSIYKQN